MLDQHLSTVKVQTKHHTLMDTPLSHAQAESWHGQVYYTVLHNHVKVRISISK